MAKAKTESETRASGNSDGAGSSSSGGCNEQLTGYIRSGKSGIYITTYEEVRVEAEFLKLIPFLNSVKKDPKLKDWDFYVWSCTEGILKLTMPGGKPGRIEDTSDPMAALIAWAGGIADGQSIAPKCPERSILLARDFNAWMDSTSGPADPTLVRKLKEALMKGKEINKVFVICGAKFNLPIELNKEMAVVDFQLPDKEQLGVVLDEFCKGSGLHMDNGERDTVLDAASGLTTSEAEDAFALSAVRSGEVQPLIVSEEKAQTVRKNGILEIVRTHLNLDDLGGLSLYKDHLWSIRNCFSKAARDYGLPSPRPVIACGQAGTGKSLSAMISKNIFNIPLLRLEAGKLFGSLVGQSEENWRTAHSTAKAVAPAIVWMDEAEGLFVGAESSGRTDGGTTNRVVKTILQDMQFNSEGLFYIFTSNDIDGFPDPLIDRCDVWSFELPTKSEREEIWKIHITKRKRKPADFDITRLAEGTEGYSGRQIEQVFVKALTIAFNDNGREPTDADVFLALSYFVPTSVTMKEQIERRRMRLKNRARPASAPESDEPAVPSKKRKIA